MEIEMKRKTIVVFVIVGLLIIGSLVVIMGIVMPRLSHSGIRFGPGMMNGAAASGLGPSGLTAVSPEGTPILATTDSVDLPKNTAIQKVGNLSVSLAISPFPPAGFQQSTFVVTLKDEKGQPVSDATVALDLTMPEMPMPSNKPEAQYTNNGLYQATGRFTMRGLWRIVVIIERKGEKNSAFFDVGL
jgi:hypothetical protein